MAKRVKRAPSLPNVTPNVRDSLAQTNRVLYQDGVEQNYRLNLAFPKDGTEPFEAPMPLQSVVTGSLPSAADYEGNIIYDTTTNTLKYSNGTAWVSLTAPQVLSLVNQTFTSSDTYTPTTGMIYCRVRVQAPGGGSGGADGVGTEGNGNTTAGAGGGEYAEGLFSAATIGANQTVTIGAVGAAGNNTGGSGGTGGTTSLGSLITAIGGSPSAGTGSNSTDSLPRQGGAGGTGGTGGYLRIPGERGEWSRLVTDFSTFAVIMPGGGGSSFLGKGARPAGGFDSGNAFAGVAGQNYGGGAAGAQSETTTGQVGATGGPGIIIIDEYVLT